MRAQPLAAEAYCSMKLFTAAGVAKVVDDVAVHGPTLRFWP